MSSEQGAFEIFVRTFAGDGGPWRVSTTGGAHPIWSKTANELMYTIDDQIMMVPYRFDGRPSRPTRLGRGHPFATRPAGRRGRYDLHPDGKRAIVATPDTTGAITYDKVVFVFNFFEELRRRLPAGASVNRE